MLTETELRDGLTTCLAVPRWVDEIAAAAPYDSLDALVRKAASAADPLTPDEIAGALAHHPRIGEPPRDGGSGAALSRAEQRSADDADPELAVAVAAGNQAYEERFGRLFLIRAAGRSRREILDELNRRLSLDPETELAVVGSELRQIALLRLPQVFGRVGGMHSPHASHEHTDYDDSDAAR